MNRDDDQQLWDLLGKCEARELSPFFARNTVRAVREIQTSSSSFLGFFKFKRLIPLASVAAAAVLVLTFLRLPHVSPANRQADEMVTALDDQDMDLIADLDDDSSPADDAMLSDDDTATL